MIKHYTNLQSLPLYLTYKLEGQGRKSKVMLLLLFLWAEVQPTLDPYAEAFL